MLKPTGLDRGALRDAFNVRRQPAERADFLLADVERRLDERLDYMKLPDVQRVLDLGCGLGRSLPVLARRFPEAELLALDQAEKPLQARQRVSVQARRGLSGLLARWRLREQTREPLLVAADAHRLPLAADSVDVIWSNLVFHWFDDPLAVLAECHRVLKPNGLLIFSAFGVDTCRELRADSTRMLLDRPGVPGVGHGKPFPEGRGGSSSDVGRMPPSPDGGRAGLPAQGGTWPSFQDMHDWGDALVGTGFEAPVMDAEHLQLSYRTPEALAADMQALVFPHRPEAFVPLLSAELVFGHAWVPVRKARADGLTPVHFVRRKGR